ncbi:hypothetical protein ACSSS7_006450 [Eimeria intestinalis]
MLKSSGPLKLRLGASSPVSSENDAGDDPLAQAADLTAAATAHAANMEAAAAHADKVLKILMIEFVQLDRECEELVAKQQEAISQAKAQESQEQQPAS